MSKDIERPFAGGRWTASQYKTFVKKTLRNAFMRWPVKQDILIASRRDASEATKAISTRSKFEYLCAICGNWFLGSEVQVDHKQPCEESDDLNQVAALMFCEEDGLQVVCKGCHLVKTQAERAVKKI